MDLDALSKIATAMVAPGKGILAADESTGTIKRRFDAIGAECKLKMNIRICVLLAAAISAPLLCGSSSHAASLSGPCPTATPGALECNPVDAFDPLPVGPSQYPAGSTPYRASATGTTGAVTATLPGVVGKTTYICSFTFGGTNASAANPAVAVTITGAITGTLNYPYPTPAAGAAVPNTPAIGVIFHPCLSAVATNTAIAVNGPALGAGATLATVSATGFQK
jgi:Fructose-bisphosphate aldolase class-I